MKTSFPTEYYCDLFFVFKYGSEFMEQLEKSLLMKYFQAFFF